MMPPYDDDPQQSACGNERHDQLMQAVLTGDLDPSADEAGELNACPICREQLEVLQATTATLSAAGREQRSILSEHQPPGELDDRVSRLIRADLGQRTSATKRSPWPMLLLAAAVIIAGLVAWAQFDERDHQPRNQLLHDGKAWPVGSISDLPQFQWPGAAGESYRLFLHEEGSLFDAWDVITCEGNIHAVTQEFVEKMRAKNTSWQWRYERTSPQQPGSPSVATSETFHFEFSQ